MKFLNKPKLIVDMYVQTRPTHPWISVYLADNFKHFKRNVPISTMKVLTSDHEAYVTDIYFFRVQ